ncbi:hypothetical protein MMC09_001460 [Bachmanniomyces sp. S44760]|nr:hypothetical protein [Bachmanniomyces sp. S44760]
MKFLFILFLTFASHALSLSAHSRPGGGHKGPCGDGRDGHSHRPHCLTQSDAESILSRWPRLFDGGAAGIDLINKTITQDYTGYDSTFDFQTPPGGPPPPDPGTVGLDAFTASRIAALQGPPVLGTYNTITFFFSCDQIGWRWNFVGQTNGIKCFYGYNTYALADAGNPVNYKGIDLLYIKPGTNLIEKSYSSGDYVNDFYAIQADFRGSPLCPGTVAASPSC